MKNWRGAGGVSPSSSNLSASAPPFTVPRAFPYPNSTPYADSAEGSSVVPPVNREHDGWESTAVLTNRYLGGSNHEVDADVLYANYYSFTGPGVSSGINTRMPSWDVPVTVTSTDCGVSHALSSSNLGKDVEAGPSYSSYSSFGVSGRDSPLTTNHTCFVGPSAPKPSDGRSDKSSSDRHTVGFSIVSDGWDDRSDGSAIGYPLKSARTDGRNRLEEDKLTREHVPRSCNRQDVWSNAWDGPTINYPLESAHVEGNKWLSEGQRDSQHLAGTSNVDVAWNDGWAGPAVEYPFKSDHEVGEESCHQAPHFELAPDIWKQQTGHTQSWDQSTWWHGPNTDYESLVMKSPSAPVAQLRAYTPNVAVGFVTQSKCNNDIDGDNANFADMMPFHSMESYPLLGTANKLQLGATYSRIQPDTNAFENLYMAKDEGLPKDKFSCMNSFDLIPQSSSTSRFSSVYLENSAIAASTHLVGDEAGSDPWGFRLSDWAANSHFSGKGLLNMQTDDQPAWDGLYTRDVPIQCHTGALFQETEVGNTNQAVSVEDSRSFLKPPAISDTSDREQRFDGTVEASSCGLKEIQSPDGTDRKTATEHDDLRVPSDNLGMNSCFPLQKKLSEDERTPHDGHPCGDSVTMNEKGVQKSVKDSAEATSALVKEMSGSNFSAPLSWNLSGKEKVESAPKVDLQLMVLTLHNLSELLHCYCSTGKCEVTEEDRHILEKAIHKLVACLAKNVVLTAEKEELKNSKEEPSQNLEGSTKLNSGQLNDQPNGDKKQVNSLCNSKEKSSWEMLSPGVDLPILKDDLTHPQVNNQILCDGEQQNLDEGKLCLETCSSGANSHPVKDNNMVQAIKEILSKNYPAGPESDPHDHIFRNLWLEAEAELCSLKCKARFDLFKSKLNAPEIKVAVEKPLRPEASANVTVEDNISCTNILEKNQKLVGSPRSYFNVKAGGERDVVASFNIPGGCCHDQNSPNDTKEERKIPVEVCLSNMAEDAGADFLSQEASISPHVSCSSSLEGTTCSGENIDAIMSRFNILLRRDERLGSQQNNSINADAAESRLEQNICHRDFPEQNKAEELESSLSENRGIPSPLVTDSFVMSRLRIIKQRDEKASSVENIVYRETAEVEPGEEPVDGDGAGEISCLSPNSEHYYDKLCSSGLAEWTRDSVLDRLMIRKLSDENQIPAENFGFGESVDLGSAIRGDYLSTFRGRTVEGSVAKAEHVLHAKAADDASKMDIGWGREDRSETSSCLNGKHGNQPSGGWFDISSSDWEHVLKEEVAGGTSER